MPGNLYSAILKFRFATQNKNNLYKFRYLLRFEETNESSTGCKTGEKCIGGYARAVTLIKQLMESRKHTNPIYLNAGDNFQGTIWYSVGRWNVTSHFLNLLKADAIVRTPNIHVRQHKLKQTNKYFDVFCRHLVTMSSIMRLLAWCRSWNR